MFLPVAQRELIAAAHRRSTYRMRWLGALAGAGVASCFFLWVGGRNPRELGAGLVAVLGGGALIFAGLAGLFLTSDAIASERRNGTLGLLFLTPLQPLDVLAGKLVAQGIHAGCAILAIFPLICLAWILGGITGGELFRFLLVLLNVLFVSLSLGLAVSAWSERPGVVVGRTAASLAALVGWAGLIGLSAAAGVGEAATWMGAWSPVGALSFAGDGSYRAAGFWGSLGLGNLTGWALLAIAAMGLRRGWRRTEESGARAGTARPRWVSPHDEEPTRLPVQAVTALLHRSRRSARLAWWAVLLPLVVFGIGAWVAGFETALGFYALASLGTGLLFKGWFSWEAVASVAYVRAQGGLELLLTTPLTDVEFGAALRRHLDRVFVAPWMVLYGLDLVLASGVGGVALGAPAAMFLIFAAAGTLLQCWCMLLGGLWWGAREPRPNVAWAKNFFLGSGLTYLAMPFCFVGWLSPLIVGLWLKARLRAPLREVVASARAAD